MKPLTFRLAICLSGLLLFSGALSAGEKKMMHCFTFTAIDAAADADWQAFFKATDELPGKIPQITRVWYGKLRAPMNLFVPDAKTAKEARTSEQKTATGPVKFMQRQWGVCMEMPDDAAFLKSYSANPAHAAWVSAYEKVRVEGTTTFDILGQ